MTLFENDQSAFRALEQSQLTEYQTEVASAESCQ